MSVLIVTYLLLDADNLRARMIRHTPAGSVARYDALANELVVYIKVRAMLGAGAAVADTVLLLVLGVPYAVLWGVLSFLFSFVPNIGFILALVPPTVFALLELGLGPAVARRRRLRRHQPRVRLHPPAADHGHGPRHQPGRRHRRDPRLDGVHRPGRRAARRAAHAGAAGRGRAVRGRPLVRRAPRAGARRDRGRPVARPYNRCRAGPRRRRSSPRDRPRLPAVRRRPTRRSRSRRTARPSSTRRAASTSTPPVGAIVVNVGHGRREIADAIAEQAARLSYAHGSAFTTEALERYAAELGPHLPVDDPAIYPVSGGSEADRDRAQARPRDAAGPRRRGPLDRVRALGQLPRQHAWARSTCPAGARSAAPYEGWLGRFRHVSAAYPYRGGDSGSQALATTQELVDELDRAISSAEPGTVCAFVGRADRRGDARPPSSRPRATGRASRTCAATTACCSSPTRS